jgi:hypothetical protein
MIPMETLTRRTWWLPRSTIMRLPVRSKAGPKGELSVAAAAGPPFPVEPETGLPGKRETSPVAASTRRTAWWPVSAAVWDEKAGAAVSRDAMDLPLEADPEDPGLTAGRQEDLARRCNQDRGQIQERLAETAGRRSGPLPADEENTCRA